MSMLQRYTPHDDDLGNYYDLKISHLAQVVPAPCLPTCPYYETCTRERTVACQKEQELYYTSLRAYMYELGIDRSAPTEVLAVTELATLDVLEGKALEMIAKDGILVASTIGVDSQDNPITEMSENPNFTILTKLWKRRSEVKKELSATRQQKAKLAAELSKRLTPAELMAKLSAAKERGTIDAEFEELG